MALTRAQAKKLKAAEKKLGELTKDAEALESDLNDLVEAAGKASDDDKADADKQVEAATKAHSDALDDVAKQQEAVDAIKALDKADKPSKKDDDEKPNSDEEVCYRQFLGTKGMSYRGDKVPNDSASDLKVYRDMGLIGPRNGPAAPPVRK